MAKIKLIKGKRLMVNFSRGRERIVSDTEYEINHADENTLAPWINTGFIEVIGKAGKAPKVIIEPKLTAEPKEVVEPKESAAAVVKLDVVEEQPKGVAAKKPNRSKK